MPYHGYYYGIDMYYIVLVLPCVLFAFWAQNKVNSTFNRYSQVQNLRGLTGAQAAEAVVASIGVAAHEAGHAVQYAIGYAPIKLRAAIIPLTQFGSMAAMPLLILGLILNTSTLVTIGIAAFGLSTLFQLVTLPVELDASRRALQTIQQNGLLTADEYPMAKKTLTAAALTYVAALATSLAQLLRLVLIFGGRDRNDR